MLKKLLKYDLKWCFKPLLVFYILTLFLAIVIRAVESFKQTFILLIIDKIACGALISMVISILINLFMRNWVRFIRNIYKDESYLTHTLPVTKNEIFLSKILTAIITLLTSFIVIIICLAIATLNENTWLLLKESLEKSAIYFNSSVFSLIAVMIITIFFETLFIIMSGILGIIIGHRSNNLKIVKSIVYGFIIYIVFSVLSLGILYMSGLIDPSIMSLFNNIKISSSSMKKMLIIGISSYFIYIILMYILGNKLLNKGVNVD